MGTTKTWQDILENKNYIDLSNERISSDVSQGYKFGVQSVTTHLSLTNPNVHNVAFQIYLSLFDVIYRRFIGRTWHGKPAEATHAELVPQPDRVEFNQPTYFHTAILDSSIMIVVEVIMILTPKDPLPGQPTTPTKQTIGWTVMRLMTSGLQPGDVNEKGQANLKKLDLFQGSPRALLFMNDPIEKNPGIKLVPGCQVFFLLSRHNALQNVAHLLPENVIFSADHKVPGVLDHYVMVDGVKDYYLKAKAKQTSTCYIDHMSIDMGKPLRQFEEELCDLVNKDRFRKAGSRDDGRVTTITARGLRVGVHNGYKFVHKPQFVHVDVNKKVGSATDLQQSEGYSSEYLILRSGLELNEMVATSGMAICFQLEYTLSMPNPSFMNVRGSRTSLFHQSQTVMVRWAWWSPSKELYDEEVCASLQGGGLANPDHQYFYRTPPSTGTPPQLGCASFAFYTTDHLKAPSLRSIPQSIVKESSSKDLEATEAPDAEITGEDHQMDIGISHIEMEDHATPVHLHPITPIYKQKTSHSRALQARIFSSDVSKIVDRHGNPPEYIEPLDQSFKFSLPMNITDPLQTNEIHLQFLAYSHPATIASEEPPTPVSSLFFSFQFYRFQPVTTQRVALEKPANNGGYQGNPDACLFRKVEAGPPGLELKYYVDPVNLKPGENSSFMHYLAAHKLYIDVWDGDSLILLGTVAVPLKHLLRNRNEAVCIDHQLDVILSEHADVAHTFTGNLSMPGKVRPLGLRLLHRGKIYLRLGNVGFPSNCKVPTTWTRNPLVVADLSGSSFMGGSISSTPLGPDEAGFYRCRVKKLLEADGELAELLLSNSYEDKEGRDKENMESITSERKRKLTRMKFVRSGEEEESARMTVGRKALLQREDRALRERDLHTIDVYRERTKGDRILGVLMLAITTHHTIRPTLGVAEFVELQLKNPFPTPQTVTIECTTSELRVVTDTREWRHYKKMCCLQTPLEEEMFTFNDDSQPQVFIRSKETVYIPFRYQSFKADHSVTVQGPGLCKATTTSLQPVYCQSGFTQSNIAKAVLRTPDGRPFSILQLHILHQPPVVDQTLRFYNPEQSFLKKCIRLPPFAPSTENRFQVVCSDPDVVCQAVARNVDEPREIYIKAPSGESPSLKKFYLCLYTDPFIANPAQTWLIYLHALQKVDVDCVMGQTSRFTMALRGTQSVRKVQCFPSHFQEIQVAPNDPFILPANGINEVFVGVRTTSPYKCTRHMYINVVDIEYHQLVRTWLIAVRTREPIISKDFNIELSRFGSAHNNKMISFTNPYPHRKEFNLLTSRADLLRFRENSFELLPGEKTSLGLRFATGVTLTGKVPVYVFINDEDDRNEETFLINVTYV